MIPVLLGAAAALAATELARPIAEHRALALPRVRNPTRARRVAVAAVALIAGALAPPLLPLCAVAWWGARVTRARRRRRAHERAVRHALPDLVDLLRLATTAGLSLALAHPLVAAHTPPPVGPALLSAHTAAGRGRPRADALLDALLPLGDRAHALAHVLGDHLRYGVPLLPGLERTGLELRLERRRAAELDARRLPVRLLAPLVTCVLPAFALLTVVPLLAASLEALPI